MKIKSLFFFVTIFLFFGVFASSQDKEEREHRIKKSQFPNEALRTIAENNKGFKRLKFYKAVGTTSKTYTSKFKKAKLFYEMNFNETGLLNGLGFGIKPVDVPEESFDRIVQYLSQNFEKSKIRKMIQAYPVKPNEDKEETIKSAFQNLMLSDIRYELFVKGQKNGVRSDFEITFDSKGNFVQLRAALPVNHDRILY